MIKHFCDIDNNEISSTEENSVYAYVDTFFDATGPHKLQKQEEYCKACSDVIKDFISGLKQSSGGSSPETPDTNPPQGLQASPSKPALVIPRQKSRS